MFMMVFQFAKLNKEDRIGKLHRIATEETNKDGTEPRHPSQSTSCSLSHRLCVVLNSTCNW